ncbi:MAG: DUF2484 family protein [bacterium]
MLSQTAPLIAACLWLILANLIAMFPSKDYHWRNAYRLMALGAPLTLWLAETQSLWIALIFLACASSILRWPLWYAWKWVRGLGKTV